MTAAMNIIYSSNTGLQATKYLLIDNSLQKKGQQA
jgi:hypothetical protein